MEPRRVVVLGSTGSIGRATLDVIAAHPGRFMVAGLAAGRDAEGLLAQVARFRVPVAALADAAVASRERPRFAALGCTLLGGPEGVEEVAAAPDADVVVAAIVGAAGIRPVLSALRAGRTVALANKEALVAAGPVVLAEQARHGARLLPVDGEHNAVLQCLAGRAAEEVARVILTASGGPFREWPLEAMAHATPAQAVRHPNWAMGAKISVDSATLMNKGLEVIEAQFLFGLELERIGVVVHPESVVHGLVELVDGGLIAHLGATDMRWMVQYCLTYPERLAGPWPRLDLAALGRLRFEPVDTQRFPCFALALAAARQGGSAPAALNAANEVAVAAFLAGHVRFTEIARVVEDVLGAHRPMPLTTLDDVLAVDAWAREEAQRVIERRTLRSG